MAELTAEVVQNIVSESVTEIVTGIVQKEVNALREETKSGIAQVLETLQTMIDDSDDEVIGVTGRLRSACA